jgi:hypothetical protein
MNPFKRFIEGYKHGYRVQQTRRLQREAQNLQPPGRLEIDRPVEIKGVGLMHAGEINFELDRGARFVVFPYCVSVLVMTFKRTSKIYFLKPSDSAFIKGLPFNMISFVAGWWGIPWGPIWTAGALATNLRGGKNVTAEVINSLNALQTKS